MEQKPIICVLGLGYVGLPLALAFGNTEYVTYGFDTNQERIAELKKNHDKSGETSDSEIAKSKVIFSSNPEDIRKANFIIVAVPTPVTKANQPDLTLLKLASKTVGQYLSKGSIVVYESTVYPGATEEICAPEIEASSKLKLGIDFKIGYSPERINPGDKEHTLEKVIKVVSGQDAEATKTIAEVYGKVCDAGVFIAKNIKTAEAEKVVENTQRDLNIALMNELSLIFHKLGIDTTDVLEAAGTKWNFLKFTPGFVGGHCIGVDPYYLVHKAEEVGYHPQVITAGRRVNDSMPEFIAWETIRGLNEAGHVIQKSKILVLGLSFKENVKDLRNSKIKITIQKLQELGILVYGYDPLQDSNEASKEFGIPIINDLVNCDQKFEAVIIAANHTIFKGLDEEILKLMEKKPVIIDIKNAYRSFRNNENLIYKNL